ncbi:hypothetical protein ACQJBY_073487 [Aegilops geniculata]
MASIPEFYSPPDTFSNLGGSCSDQERISILRKIIALGARLYFQPPRLQTSAWHLMRHDSEAMEGWTTDQGTWSPKKLVSIPNYTSQGNSLNSPKFVGTKTTLEFKPTGAKKGVAAMTRYHLVRTMKDRPGLYLEEELSLCFVFPLKPKNPNGKRQRSGSVADQFKDFAPPPVNEVDQVMSDFDYTSMHPLDLDDYVVDGSDLPSSDSSKHPRLESKHWHNFTKIYTKNPQLMYAACSHCDTMLKLKGGSSCGTGSLRHHNDSCPCKPMQEQLPGDSSSMPIPSIAL